MRALNQKKASNFYQNLLFQLPGLVVVGDLKSHCIYTNRKTANLFGFCSEDSMLGITPHDMRCPAVENADEFLSQNQEVIDTNKELTILDIHTYVNDQQMSFLTKKIPYILNNKTIGSIFYSTELNSDTLRQICATLIQSDKKFQKKYNKDNRSYTIISSIEKNKLSERELECMFYLIRGNTMKEIGKQLSISHRTVETYLEQIKEKLNCTNKAQIIEYGLAHGYINFLPKTILTKNISGVIYTSA